jgi:hypothetical protein
MRKARVWRQGDIIIRELTETPSNDELRDFTAKSEYVIASETGKPHRIIAKQILVNEYMPERQYIISPSEEVVVTHPEHGKMVIPKGIYMVTRVREAISNSIRTPTEPALD